MSDGRAGRRRRAGRRADRPDSRGSLSRENEAARVAARPLTSAAHLDHDVAGAHELPHESLTPITLAAGIALLAFGLLTSLVFSAVGIAVIGWALGSWIEEMRHG